MLEKRLRPLKKGTARLAFGAQAALAAPLNLQVLPVGINYTYPCGFRREVMIGVGAPIAMPPLAPLYAANPARAIRQFNRRLAQELEKNIISIASPAQEALAEAHFVSSRARCPDFRSPAWLSSSPHRLQTEIGLAQTLAPPAAGPAGAAKAPAAAWTRAGLLLGLPVALLGLAGNFLPLWLARALARKKVRKKEFYASVLVVLGLVLYAGYWLLLALGAAAWAGMAGLGFCLLLPVTGYLALRWWDAYRLLQLRRCPLVGHPVKAQGFEHPVG